MLVDVEELLDALDIDVISSGETEIRGECPVHDKPGSQGDWYINSVTGKHHCWSCGFAGDYKSLVEAVLGVDRFHAVSWLIQQNLISADEQDWVPEPKKDPEPDVVGESSLVLYHDVPKGELRARRITRTAADLYGIRWDESRNGWVIPIRYPDGRLMGVQLKRGGFVMNHPKGMRKGQTLFGLQQWRGPYAVLLESPLDVVRLASIGERTGLATFGAEVTSYQLSVLADYTDHVVLAFDNDNAGRAATEKVASWASGWMTVEKIYYRHTEAKDIGDMTDDEIDEALDRAKPVMTRRAKNVPIPRK